MLLLKIMGGDGKCASVCGYDAPYLGYTCRINNEQQNAQKVPPNRLAFGFGE